MGAFSASSQVDVNGFFKGFGINNPSPDQVSRMGNILKTADPATVVVFARYHGTDGDAGKALEGLLHGTNNATRTALSVALGELKISRPEIAAELNNISNVIVHSAAAAAHPLTHRAPGLRQQQGSSIH